MIGSSTLGGRISLHRAPFTAVVPAGLGHKHPSIARSPLQVKATGEGEQQPNESEKNANGKPPQQRQRRRRRKQDKEPDTAFSLEDLNPITMGRKSRQAIDYVWEQLQRIGSIQRSVTVEELPFE